VLGLAACTSADRDLHSSGSVQLLELRLAPWRTVTGSVQLLEVADCTLALAAIHWPGGISVVTTPPPEHQLCQTVGMRAREAAAARARDAAAAEAAAHAETLLLFQIPGTPEELAVDAAADKHASENQQAGRARAKNRAVSEKEQKQRDHYEKAAKLAKKRAADRERKQKLRNNEAFRDLEVRCYLCARTQSVF